MLKPDKIFKAYGAQMEQTSQMAEEINTELKELGALLDFPSQITEQLPLPLSNNLLREDEPRTISDNALNGERE